MNDVVLEWIIPYVMPAKKRLLKAVLVSLLIVLLADAVLFYAFLLLPAIVLGIVEFFLFRSWKLEYEYVYVNGDFTISKIIRKEKRKDLYRCDRKDMEYVAEGRAYENNKLLILNLQIKILYCLISVGVSLPDIFQ